MVSWISDNRKMPAGGWGTVLFSLFFNGIRKKRFHTKKKKKDKTNTKLNREALEVF